MTMTRRSKRRIGWALLAVIGVALVLVASGWLLLHSRWVGDRARDLALERLRPRIAGSVDVGRVRLGLKRIQLFDLTLRTPEGEPVAEVARVEVDLSVRALLDGRIDVARLVIERPRVGLTKTGDHLDLMRAIASPPQWVPQKGDGPPSVSIREITLEGGVLALPLRDRSGAHLTLRELRGGGSLHDGRLAFRLHADPEAGGGTSLTGTIDLFRLQGQGRVHVVLPGMELRASGSASRTRLDVQGELIAHDLQRLRRTLVAAHGLPLPEVAGQGRLVFSVAGSPARSALRIEGRFPTLAVDAVRAVAVSLGLVIPDLSRPRLFDLSARADRARVSDQSWQRPQLRWQTPRGREFAAEIAAVAPYPISIATAGTWEARLESLTVDRLAITYPEGRWHLVRPVRVQLPPGPTAVHGLSLASGPQRLTLSLARTGARWSIRAVAKTMNLGRLPAIIVPANTLSGIVDARVALQGRIARPEVQLEAQARGLSIHGRLLGEVDLRVDGTAAKPVTLELTLHRGRGKARMVMATPFSTSRLLHGPPLSRRALLSARYRLNATVERVPLATIAALLGRAGEYGGTLAARLEMDGTPLAPRGRLHLEVDQASLVSASGWRLPQTDLTLDVLAQGPGRGLDAKLEVSRDQRPLARANAHMDLRLTAMPDVSAVLKAPIIVTADVGPLRLRRVPESQPPDHGALEALVAGQVQLRGSLAAPRLAARAEATDLRLGRTRFGRALLHLSYEAHRAELGARFTSRTGETLQLDATADVDLSAAAVASGLDLGEVPVAATLRAQRFDLAFLSGATRSVHTVDGTLDAQLEARGRLASPTISGTLAWRDGRLDLAGLGSYREIQLHARGDQRRFVLERLFARAGQGWLDARGAVEFPAGSLPTGFALNVSSHAFPLYLEGQRIADVSVRTAVDGMLSRKEIACTARVREAHVEIAPGRRKDVQPLKRPPDVVVFDNGVPRDQEQAAKRRRLLAALEGRPKAPIEIDSGPLAVPVRITIQAPRNVWIRGHDVNLELGVENEFSLLVNTEPRLFGTVVVQRGHIELLGRRFVLDRNSTARFTGDPGHPLLAVRATHEAKRAEMTIVISLAGPPDRLTLELTSPEYPDLGDTELLTVLATGRLPDERAGVAATASGRAASLLGRFLANRLQRTLSGRLPIDVLTIDPGEGLTGTRLEAGTYLSDNVYVAYVARIGADPFLRQNRNEIHLEYQISRRWSFEASYGDAQRGSGDLIWTRHY